MKSPKHFFIIFVFTLLAFSPTFFRELPYGMDSFYYLNSICGKGNLNTEPIGAILVFSLLPCNIYAIKVLFFICCFASGLFISKLAGLFGEKGWLAGIFVFASPIWLLEFWKIENDAFAYAILFTAAYFFFKGLKQNSSKNKLLGVFLVLVAQLFWEGSVLWLIAFSLTWFWLALPILPALAFKFWEFVAQIAPNFNAAESTAGFGLLYQMFLLTALMYLSHLPLMIAPIGFFIIIALINAKFAIHATALLAIAATKQFENTKTIFNKWFPAFGAVIVVLFLASMSQDLPPDSQELAAAQLAISEAKGEEICNDWGTGHLLAYLGGNPVARSGGKELCQGCTNCIILSYREFDCPIINGAEKEMDIRVYRC